MKVRTFLTSLFQIIITLSLLGVMPAAAALQDGTSTPSAAQTGFKAPEAKFSTAVAFDVSRPLRELAAKPSFRATPKNPDSASLEIRPERNVPGHGDVIDKGFSGDGALQTSEAGPQTAASLSIPAPIVNFDGLRNEDNFNIFGFRVNPPDPNGDVGPNHFVEMINLVFGVYDKQGNLLLGPVDTGSLWANFAVPDCTDPSGDPIVLYDQLEDRWLLTQFTTRGPLYYDCVAISQTGDPTGAYYRYAFVTQPDPSLPGGSYFPDYPKYSVWTNSYLMTTRDFGDTSGYGISVYALEKNKMLVGDPKARAVQFFLNGDDPNILPLVGDGLLPSDIDGTRRPVAQAPAVIVGTQDDGAGYGGTFDALNIFELSVLWNSKPIASLSLKTQLPVAAFDSIFPCAPTSRDCLPQPGITNPNQYLDILSYRQRPTFRLAYRNFGTYESFVTSQSVEAMPGVAGMRWYEIRRSDNPKPDTFSLFQQGTYAPGDGVHRWMGSIAQDRQGNMALGYSVVNATDVYPGIRYTGRMAGDPLGQMTLGEGTIINGSGVQTTTNSRWGDYTSMNVDPVDDCTFWYTNEYYQVSGTPADTRPWQTRIASFTLPGCTP